MDAGERIFFCVCVCMYVAGIEKGGIIDNLCQWLEIGTLVLILTMKSH